MATVHDDSERDPLDLLAEQFLQRVRRGDVVTPESFADGHPEHAAALRDLLPTLLLLEQARRERESDTGGARRVAVPQLARLGDYRIVREVGRGGMGVVFEAEQQSLGRRVALKVLPQASLLSGNQLERFRREARAAAQLHHTHIVPVFDSGDADGYHYYAMQFIDGRGLDAVVRELQRAREEPGAGGAVGDSGVVRAQARRCARLGAAVAEALHHAHEHGLLHRDVKPANLLVSADDHVWVTDFGLAKALQQEGLTQSGDVVGTLQYMAPEQFDGQYDARSEVYALGATLYELLALRPAFSGRTRSEVVERIRAGRCERLQRLLPALPRDLDTIVQKAMAADPAARYASAAAMAEDLHAFADDRPIAARRRSVAASVGWWCRRNKALAGASAVAAVAVLTAAIVGWTSYWRTDAALLRVTESEKSAKAATAAAVAATQRAEANLDDTLQVMAAVFDTLVGPDPLHAQIEDVDGDGSAVATMLPPIDDDDLELLQKLLEFYDRFAVRNEGSPRLRAQTARAHARVGAIQVRLGDLDAAVAAYREALQRLLAIGDADATRERAGLLQELGQVQVRRGDARGAADSFGESLALLGRSGDGSRSSRWLLARAHYLRATVFQFRERPMEPRRGGPWRLFDGRRRGDGGPRGHRDGPPGEPPGGDPRDRDPRARDLRDRDPRDRDPRERAPWEREPPERDPRDREPGERDPRGGEPGADARGERRAPDGRPQRPWAAVQQTLADEAAGHLDAAEALLRDLLQEQPDDAECRFLQARCLRARDRAWGPPGAPRALDNGEHAAAARAILEELVAAHPENDDYRFELCEVLLPEPRPDRADLADLRAAVAHAETLVEHQSGHPEYQALLGRSLGACGTRLAADDATAGAELLQRALEVLRPLATPADGDRAEPRFVRDAVGILRRLMRIRLDAGDLAAARSTGQDLLRILIEAVQRGGLRGPEVGERPVELLQQLERVGLGDRAGELRQLLERRNR